MLTNNLIDGMALGTFSTVAIAVALGRARDVTGIVWGLAAVFVAFFVVTARFM